MDPTTCPSTDAPDSILPMKPIRLFISGSSLPANELASSEDPKRFAPILEMDALMLEMAPVMVLDPIVFAAPPMPASIAFWNDSTSISPFWMDVLKSSIDLPVSFAKSCQIGMPLSASWFISSVVTLPLAATLLKMEPISPMSMPATAAASPMSVRYRVNSLPGLMPAAVAEAAAVMAASMPYAVPLTAAFAFLDICSTVLVLLPSAVSFAFALSIAVILEKPLVKTAPMDVAMPTAPMALTAVLPKPAANPLPDLPPASFVMPPSSLVS